MPIRIKIKKKGYVPHPNFSPITWEYIPLETEVQIIAQRPSSKGAWAKGDKAVVTGIFPAGSSRDVHPRDDLYRVQLSEPRKDGIATGYFYYFELERTQDVIG